MVSDIQNSSSAVRTPLVMPAAPAVAAPSPAPDKDSSPKVVAPKPIDIRYDPAQAARNLQEAVHSLNQQLESQKTGLGFSIDKSLNTPVVIVTNAETGEVVRKIPTEQVLQMAHSIDDMKGLLLNAKV